MDWPGYLQSTLAGVSYVAIWSGLLYLANFIRNQLLERQLRRIIQPKELSGRERRVHLVILNRTRVDVTVRGVRLVTGDGHLVPLEYMGDTGDFVDGLDPHLDHNDRTHHAVRTDERPGLDQRGFVDLPQQTGGLWLLSLDDIRSADWTFTDCAVVVEYPTIFRNHKVIKVHADQSVLSKLQEEFDGFIRQLDEGEREDLRNRDAPAAGTR